MKLLGAMSLPRERMLEYKADAFKKMLTGVLSVTRLNYPQIQRGLNAYLLSEGLKPDDESVLAWLQDNPGEIIGIFIFELDNGQIGFRIALGTQAELRQIGEQYGKGSNNSKRSSRIGKIDMGQGARVVKPRRL
jgi:hypothetical protein